MSGNNSKFSLYIKKSACLRPCALVGGSASVCFYVLERGGFLVWFGLVCGGDGEVCYEVCEVNLAWLAGSPVCLPGLDSR